MPKIKWSAADEDEILTADDIESAEEGYQAYTGDIPPGGVYRFKLRRSKYTEFSSGNQGFNNLLILDGSWKPDHKEYDGCPLWDRVAMTKAAAGFAKAFALALGVSPADLISKVVVDEDGVVTKIGPKTIDDNVLLYVAVKRGSYNDEPRLETVGTGYQVVESSNGSEDPWATEPKAEAAKAKGNTKKVAKGKKGKASEGLSNDEPPF